MNIKLIGKRGRTELTANIEVDDLSSEENLQEFFLSVIEFAIAMGAELPDELKDMIDEYLD